MSLRRYTAQELLTKHLSPPDRLDYLEFEFDGVTVRCFGVLHGITGGLNRCYRRFVKQSIRSIEGTVLAEKGMKSIYRNCGIDAELEDWLVLRPIDALLMGVQLIADPRCLWMITIDALRELLRRSDPFTNDRNSTIESLGESPYFHHIDPIERRKLAGFETSERAIRRDLYRLEKWYRVVTSGKGGSGINNPRWRRILLLERFMHIPARSLHMLYYATAYAKTHNLQLINLVVGETHNSDMAYIANNSIETTEAHNRGSLSVVKRIVSRARRFGGYRSTLSTIELTTRKSLYMAALLLGASIPVISTIVIILAIPA